MRKDRKRCPVVKRRPVIQPHHISYEPEVVVKVYKGEHMLLTKLGWRKRISKGFIQALEDWLTKHKAKAEDLK